MLRLADLFYELSREEMIHANKLHEAVVEIIKVYREEHGDPPADMQAVYEYLHKKHVEKMMEVKALQAMYKGG